MLADPICVLVRLQYKICHRQGRAGTDMVLSILYHRAAYLTSHSPILGENGPEATSDGQAPKVQIGDWSSYEGLRPLARPPIPILSHNKEGAQADPSVGSCGCDKYSDISQGHSLLVVLGTGGRPPSSHGATELGKQPPYHGSGRLLLEIDQSGQLPRFGPSRFTILEVGPSHQHSSGPVCGLGTQADNHGIKCKRPAYAVPS